MPKNEEGEFELILGNRQLLSVFFIVVVLLGVFFTMGYIVGRNSSPVVSADGRKTEMPPIQVGRAAASGSTTDSAADTSARTAVPESSTAEPAPPNTPPTSEPEQKAAEPPAAARKAEHKAEPKPEPASPTPGVPAAGATYLQLAAIAKPEAELFVDVLAKKGFHAIYAPVPEKATFRVLVGPFPNTAAVSQARTDLTKAGFKGFEAIVRTY